MGDKLSFRYYFTLESGVTPSQITLTANYNQCLAPTGPTLHAGSVYYVTVSCTGVKIYPGGQSNYRKEVQFRIASSGAWDPSNDWSFTGVGDDAGLDARARAAHSGVRQRRARVRQRARRLDARHAAAHRARQTCA